MAAVPLPARGRRGALPEPEEPERARANRVACSGLDWTASKVLQNKDPQGPHVPPLSGKHPVELNLVKLGWMETWFTCPMGQRTVKYKTEASLAFKNAKRVCKPVEIIPKEADAFLVGCAMELDSKQKTSADWGPWPAKTKQNSVIFENHGSRGTAQPCPRCIAGESGHFNHILGF